MSFIRGYLTTIISTGVITALVLAILPESDAGGRRAVRMCGGIILAIALIVPLKSLSPDDISRMINNYAEQIDYTQSALTQQYEQQKRQLVEENTAAYVAACAAELGMDVNVTIEAAAADSQLYPYAAVVRYRSTATQAEMDGLAGLITDALGIPAARQRHLIIQ